MLFAMILVKTVAGSSCTYYKRCQPGKFLPSSRKFLRNFDWLKFVAKNLGKFYQTLRCFSAIFYYLFGDRLRIKNFFLVSGVDLLFLETNTRVSNKFGDGNLLFFGDQVQLRKHFGCLWGEIFMGLC